MKKNVLLILILLGACTNSEEISEEIINCPETFLIPNEIRISEINVLSDDNQLLRYITNSENKLIEHYRYDYKYDYIYNSCGLLEQINQTRQGEETKSYLKNKYDKNGKLIAEIRGEEGYTSIIMFEHNENENSAVYRQYLNYNEQTGELSLPNLKGKIYFDENDNMIKSTGIDSEVFSTIYEYDNNFNLTSTYNAYSNTSNVYEYHNIKNPFFVIMSKTYGRKNIFLTNQINPVGLRTLIEFGLNQNLILEYDDQIIIVNNSKNNFATSFNTQTEALRPIFKYEVTL